MRRPRFTIRGMMIAVVIAAVAFTVLIYTTPLWASAAFTLAFGSLLFSIPGIVYRRGRKRAFWVGFCVFGWGQFLWTLLFTDFHRYNAYLLTTFIPIFFGALLKDPPGFVSDTLTVMFDPNASRGGESFHVVIQSLITLGVAYVGGVAIARTLGAEAGDGPKELVPPAPPRSDGKA